MRRTQSYIIAGSAVAFRLSPSAKHSELIINAYHNSVVFKAFLLYTYFHFSTLNKKTNSMLLNGIVVSKLSCSDKSHYLQTSHMSLKKDSFGVYKQL